MKLPLFGSDGLLPPGNYEMTIAELMSSSLVQGQGSPTWDSSWRKHLVENLAVMVGQLKQIGITEIYIDGSFAEDKDRPSDIDGYFECNAVDWMTGKTEQELNLLDPHKVWTWDPAARRAARGYSKRQLPMWHQYRVELYPHYGFGPFSGITDAHGHNLLFPSAFRSCRRTGKQKGILKIGGLA